jgi:hypothetical protein
MLNCENPDEFEETIATHFADYQPANGAQERLVKEMISTSWRLRRIRIVETQLIDLEMIRNREEVEKQYAEPNSTIHLTEAFRKLIDETRTLSLISRYESRLRRMHDRAYSTLRELQAQQDPPAASATEHTAPEPPVPQPEAAAESAPPAPEIKNEETNPPRCAASHRAAFPRMTQSYDSKLADKPWKQSEALPIAKFLRRS